VTGHINGEELEIIQVGLFRTIMDGGYWEITLSLIFPQKQYDMYDTNESIKGQFYTIYNIKKSADIEKVEGGGQGLCNIKIRAIKILIMD
jgi:hypothetical protein